MATYAELLTASTNTGLADKVKVACIIAAESVRTESPEGADHDARRRWASAVFANPAAEASRMLWAVLAQNKDATLAQITGASDAAVQTAVNNAVNVFARQS